MLPPPPPTSFISVKTPPSALIASLGGHSDELMKRLSSRREQEAVKTPKKIEWEITHHHPKELSTSEGKVLKFVIISDTHNKHDMLQLPEGDVFIHCGDMTDEGNVGDIEKFNEWIGTLPYKHKIVICGNHEVEISKLGKDKIQQLFSNAIYLENSSVTIEDNVKIYGCPYIPNMSDLPGEKKEYMSQFDNDYFYRSEEALAEIFSTIDEDTNILITHTPPKGHLDGILKYGSPSLTKRMNELKHLRVNCFGHVHMGYGYEKTSNGVTVINAASDGEEQPIYFDYKF